MSTIIELWNNRLDLAIIGNMIEEGSKVLDLGCGSGKLLDPLIRSKGIQGTGIDIDQEKLIQCIAKGIPVVQQDLNSGLSKFNDQSFDYVVLSQTLQVVHHPEELLSEMLRVGRYGIVSFPNFGHFRLLFDLLFRRKAPRSRSLPYEWYNTPNIHVLTIKDFHEFCRARGISILKEYHYHGSTYSQRMWFANTLSEGCVALIARA